MWQVTTNRNSRRKVVLKKTKIEKRSLDGCRSSEFFIYTRYSITWRIYHVEACFAADRLELQRGGQLQDKLWLNNCAVSRRTSGPLCSFLSQFFSFSRASRLSNFTETFNPFSVTVFCSLVSRCFCTRRRWFFHLIKRWSFVIVGQSSRFLFDE